MTHLDRRRRAASLISLVAALAALVAFSSTPGAGAQAPEKPVPGCAGLAATDSPGDSTSGENTEIVGLFFKTVGSRTTANIQIKNLTTEIPPAATGVSWYVVWNTADGERFVSGAIESFTEGPTFSYGSVETAQYSHEGETGGRFHEGPDGVIEIQIPGELGASRGKVLEAPYAEAAETLGVAGTGLVRNADTAPDEGGGTDYLVMPCETAPPPGAGGPTPTTLPVTLSTKSVRAKATRNRRLKVKLRSTERVEDLGGQLRKGSRILGTGTRRALEGDGKLKLKLKRRLKKGSYVLELTGTVGDQAASKSFKLKVR